MTFSIQCDRCGQHGTNRISFKELQYRDIGDTNYVTVHLCEVCFKLFKEFMKI